MTNGGTPDPGSIASEIRADLVTYKAEKRRKWRPKSNAASQLGHPCALETGRYLYIRRITPEENLALHPVAKQFLFDDGNTHEEAVIADLKAAGHQVDRGQASYTWDAYQISGKIDGFIYTSAGAFPLEAKAMSPSLFRAAAKAAINGVLTWDRIKATRNDWIAKYAVQLNTYLLMTGRPLGIFAFKDKESGDIAIYGWALDYDLGETAIKRAEEINAAMAGTGPEPKHCTRPDLCGRCEICHICKPPLVQFGETREIMDNPDLEAKLIRLEELEPAYKEYKTLDEQIKAAVRGKIGVLGDFEIDGAWSESPAQVIPEHTEPPRRQWRRKITKWRKTA